MTVHTALPQKLTFSTVRSISFIFSWNIGYLCIFGRSFRISNQNFDIFISFHFIHDFPRAGYMIYSPWYMTIYLLNYIVGRHVKNITINKYTLWICGIWRYIHPRMVIYPEAVGRRVYDHPINIIFGCTFTISNQIFDIFISFCFIRDFSRAGYMTYIPRGIWRYIYLIIICLICIWYFDFLNSKSYNTISNCNIFDATRYYIMK